ncbi:MAG: serine hydrolase [Deltaproteobacteria bacterium]|nr:serine hydrolase [Deltaproteobacteria bacterium]
MSLEAIDAACLAGSKEKLFPGAALLVGKGQEALVEKYYGHFTYETNSLSVTASSYFDIASLTKAIATTCLFMLASQEGRLDLNQPARNFFPTLTPAHNYSITQLLNHTSGLRDWLPLYQQTHRLKKGKLTLENLILNEIQEKGLDRAKQGSHVYSDLNFILLGFILEKIYEKKLDVLFQEKVAGPLNIKDMFYLPLIDAPSGAKMIPVDRNDTSSFVPTEFCTWRNRTIQGEVHDENTYFMRGVAGHAGLFATLRAVGQWVQEMLKAHLGNSSWLKKSTFEIFVPQAQPYFLGFDRPNAASLAGKYFSKNSIGHLAFTGCSFWLDLEDQKSIVLLTNRTYPKRYDKTVFNQFRIKIHNLICEELF